MTRYVIRRTDLPSGQRWFFSGDRMPYWTVAVDTPLGVPWKSLRYQSRRVAARKMRCVDMLESGRRVLQVVPIETEF